MYAPNQFREERRDVLVAAIRDIQFGVLVSPDADGLQATHLPVVVREDGEQAFIEFHVARANPHWKSIGGKSLMIFQGPSAYIHPGWYASKPEHGRVVPTWTYVVVHAHGKLETFENDELLAHVTKLTSQNEAMREKPWAVSDAPSKYVEGMTRAIVGMRMTVERLEGSWKLNQHKSDGDRAGVMSGLADEANPDARSIADLMQTLEDERSALAEKRKVDPT